jgi:hypothetical protein
MRFSPFAIDERALLPLPIVTPSKTKRVYRCKAPKGWLLTCNLLLVVIMVSVYSSANSRPRHDTGGCRSTIAPEPSYSIDSLPRVGSDSIGVGESPAAPPVASIADKDEPALNHDHDAIESDTHGDIDDGWDWDDEEDEDFDGGDLDDEDEDDRGTVASADDRHRAATIQNFIDLVQQRIRSVEERLAMHRQHERGGERPYLQSNIKCIAACIRTGAKCGWYSASMEEVSGTSFYATPDDPDQEVEVTLVADPESAADAVGWRDLRCVGPVTTWLREGKPDPHPPIPLAPIPLAWYDLHGEYPYRFVLR